MEFIFEQSFIGDFDIMHPLKSLASSLEEHLVLVASIFEVDKHLLLPVKILVLLFDVLKTIVLTSVSLHSKEHTLDV